MLTGDQRRALLEIARQSVHAAIRGAGRTQLVDAPEDPALGQPRGAFVTLKTAGRLRGCIGQFTADGPLWQTIARMARAAAVEDPRFIHERLRSEELDRLDIEISVLSPLQRTDDPLSLELGTHGIYVRNGPWAGCFLPQVATETGWSKEEFLTHCCAGKAGLRPDAWRDPATEVYLFTAEIIEEP
jgi:AmmeMemoRadiSam system protein A